MIKVTLIPEKLLDPIKAARYLLGAHIIRTLPDSRQLVGRIVETESYHQSDPASHTHRGQTVRNAAMFGPSGHAYIYFTYGVHWCFNVTAGKVGYGAGILIRAVEPLEGVEELTKNRNGAPHSQLTNGPAKVAQAFAIDKKLYGHDLRKPPLQIVDAGMVKDSDITTATRIGISAGVDELLRFYITGSSYISKT